MAEQHAGPRWARVAFQGEECFGTLVAETIVEYSGDMFAQPRPTGREIPIAEVEFLTPVVPSKCVALANNYHALIEKAGLTVPEEPLYFFKANSSLHPTGQPIRRPTAYQGKIIFEGELGLVIGKTCRDVDVGDAYSYLFGCTCVNDVTSIELLNKNPSFQQCRAARPRIPSG